MISTLSEISGRFLRRPLRGRVDARGCVSVPGAMGCVTLSCEEDGDNLIITAEAAEGERKRFHYLGIQYFRPYLSSWVERSISFVFTPTGPTTWTATINRRGQQD